jgi:hypothetical protein
MKLQHLLLLLISFTLCRAIENEDKVLRDGARVTWSEGSVYKVYLEWSPVDFLPNGAAVYYEDDIVHVDVITIHGSRPWAFRAAGNASNAANLATGRGYQWVNDVAFFSIYFKENEPDRWD